jgi:hypothetical protein
MSTLEKSREPNKFIRLMTVAQTSNDVESMARVSNSGLSDLRFIKKSHVQYMSLGLAHS